jgi:hypothetical protein
MTEPSLTIPLAANQTADQAVMVYIVERLMKESPTMTLIELVQLWDQLTEPSHAERQKARGAMVALCRAASFLMPEHAVWVKISRSGKVDWHVDLGPGAVGVESR